MKVSIIKYNAGNVYSVECALRRLGVTPVVSDSPDVLSQSDKVLFPGVGEASSAMKYLQEHGLDRVIVDLTQPVLAICIGLQLLCKHSEEGDVDTLGIISMIFVTPNEKYFDYIDFRTLGLLLALMTVMAVSCLKSVWNVQL